MSFRDRIVDQLSRIGWIFTIELLILNIDRWHFKCHSIVPFKHDLICPGRSVLMQVNYRLIVIIDIHHDALGILWLIVVCYSDISHLYCLIVFKVWLVLILVFLL